MSKWLRWGIVLLCCLVLANCSPQTPQTLSFTTLAEEDHSGWEGDAALFVISSEKDVQTVNEFAVPDIQRALAQMDFTTDLAILILRGASGGGAAEFSVQGVELQDHQITISTLINDYMGTNEVTSQYHLIQVSRTGLQGKKLNFNLIFEPEGDLVATVSHRVQ